MRAFFAFVQGGGSYYGIRGYSKPLPEGRGGFYLDLASALQAMTSFPYSTS